MSGSTLFVATMATGLGVGKVGADDASTGAATNANLITGLNNPGGLLLSGNTLFVADSGLNTIGEYNAATGATIKAHFITGSMNPVFANGLAFASVPEPSTWSMIGVAGLALSFGIMRRKKHRPA